MRALEQKVERVVSITTKANRGAKESGPYGFTPEEAILEAIRIAQQRIDNLGQVDPYESEEELQKAQERLQTEQNDLTNRRVAATRLRTTISDCKEALRAIKDKSN